MKVEILAYAIVAVIVTAMTAALVAVVGGWLRHFIWVCRESRRFRWDMLGEYVIGVVIGIAATAILKLLLYWQ